MNEITVTLYSLGKVNRFSATLARNCSWHFPISFRKDLINPQVVNWTGLSPSGENPRFSVFNFLSYWIGTKFITIVKHDWSICQVSLLFPANTFTIKTNLIMLLTTVNLHCTENCAQKAWRFFLCVCHPWNGLDLGICFWAIFVEYNIL